VYIAGMLSRFRDRPPAVTLAAVGFLLACDILSTVVLLFLTGGREAYSAFDFQNGAADLLILALLRAATLALVARMLVALRSTKTEGRLALISASDPESGVAFSPDEARSRRLALTLFVFVACSVWQVPASTLSRSGAPKLRSAVCAFRFT
jgi:hypothetical protein